MWRTLLILDGFTSDIVTSPDKNVYPDTPYHRYNTKQVFFKHVMANKFFFQTYNFWSVGWGKNSREP